MELFFEQKDDEYDVGNNDKNKANEKLN